MHHTLSRGPVLVALEANPIQRYILAILMVSMLWVPAAAADHIDHVEETDDHYLVVRGHGDEDDADRLAYDATCDLIYQFCNEPRYQSEATVSIWEETNACDGLQERQIDCDGDGEYEETDTLVFSEGCFSGGMDPCGHTSVI